MLERIQADVFIDDNFYYVRDVFLPVVMIMQCKEHVRIPILFGNYGWNYRSDASDYEGITRFGNWEDVCNYLMNYKFDESFVSS